MFPGSTETVLYDLFDCGLFPYHTLMDKFQKLNKHVSFVFGDKDWVDSTGAEVLTFIKTQGLYADDCLS